MFLTFQSIKERSWWKQYVLCTTTSSLLTVETMIEGQCQVIQWVMVSTEWPPPSTWYNVWKFSWPCKKVKKRSSSKQQVLCTTSSSQLTVQTMIEGPGQAVQWVMGSTKWPPFMVQCVKVFVTLQKGQERVKVKTTGLYNKLHVYYFKRWGIYR